MMIYFTNSIGLEYYKNNMKRKSRLGHRQIQLMEELSISTGDMFVGFLLSSCSTRRMYQVAHKSAKSRAYKQHELYAEKNRLKRSLRQLEKQGYLRLSGLKDSDKIKITEKGRRQISWKQTIEQTKAKQSKKWDGQWTVVFFDVPKEQKSVRYALGKLLKDCGFIQAQLSVYVFPYECPELIKALAEFPTWGRYCQVMRGRYYGDESKLQKEFKLGPRS